MHDPPQRQIRRASARHRFRPLLTSALLVLLLPASGLATSGLGPALNGKLAYTKISFTYQLFTLGASGSELKPLIASSAPSRAAVESPDGAQIAFMSTRGEGRWNIFLAAANGTNIRQLTNDSEREAGAPSWSPDGQKIVFSSEGLNDTQIRTIRLDGSGETIVTSGSYDFFPNYSPDGAQIVFERVVSARYDEGVSELWTMNADGSSPKLIVGNSDGRCGTPSWSPDGAWIAFSRTGSASTRDIWIVHPDGSAATDLTPGGGIDVDVSWSNDSQSVLFTRKSSRPVEAWSLLSVSVQGGSPVSLASFPNRFLDSASMGKDGRILVDGTAVSRRLDVCVHTANRERCFGEGRYPALSPDGKKLIFIRNGRLMLASVASGKPRLMKWAGGSAGYPTWSPDGHSIAFAAFDGGQVGLFTLDMRGRHKRHLLLRAGGLGSPSWSRGGLIAYTGLNSRGKSSIWVVKPNGHGRRSLISTGADSWRASWSPNGRSIAFLSNQSGFDEVYVRRAAGGAAQALTASQTAKNAPFWSPDGSKVGFTQAGGWGEQRLVVVPASGGTTSLLFGIPQLVDQGDWRK